MDDGNCKVLPSACKQEEGPLTLYPRTGLAGVKWQPVLPPSACCWMRHLDQTRLAEPEQPWAAKGSKQKIFHPAWTGSRTCIRLSVSCVTRGRKQRADW
jgi:hypothetical protein